MTFFNFSDLSQVSFQIIYNHFPAANLQAAVVIQNPSDTFADLTLKLGKHQSTQQQMIAGKSFTSSGVLTFNNATKK